MSGHAAPDTALRELASAIARREAAYDGLKPDNQACVVFATPACPAVTEYAVVYLHGLTASQGDGAPAHRHLASAIGGNLYLARLPGHGLIDDEAAAGTSAEDFVAAAEHAFGVARQLGRRVVLVGSSLGASLCLLLAARHGEWVAACVLWSPGIRPHEPALLDAFCDHPAAILRDQRPRSPAQLRYWSANVHRDAYRALRALFAAHMLPQTFTAIRAPVFMALYDGPDGKDTTASVEAMHTMFDALGTAATKKRTVAYADGAHAIASPARSPAAAQVEADSIDFLRQMLGLP